MTAAVRHLSEAELIERAGRGDADAFAALMTAHRDRLWGVCRRITCHEDDAQEALQNAMISAWQHLAEFDGRSAVGTWLYRLATNSALDEVRRRRRVPEPAETLPEPRGGRGIDGGVVARVDVDRALARIPPQFRAVVVLRELGGLSYQEMADLLELPIDTVKSQLSRGRRALADLLGAGERART